MAKFDLEKVTVDVVQAEELSVGLLLEEVDEDCEEECGKAFNNENELDEDDDDGADCDESLYSNA